MISLLRDKRGVEIQFRTAFEMAIAAIVLIMFMKNLYGVGSTVVFQEQTIVDDVGLALDALQAVRPDVNVVTSYQMPAKFGVEIASKRVTVFEKKPEDGRVFWFTEDPDFSYSYGAFPAQAKLQTLIFFKIGNSAGVLKPEQSYPKLSLPYCKPGSFSKVRVQFESQSIASIGSQPVEIYSGGATIFAAVESGTPIVKVFVNNNPDSAELACNIVQSLFKTLPNLEGYAIVPLNAELMSRDDPRLAVASASGLAAFVQLSLPGVDSRTQAGIAQGISGGVKNFVV
jgi:hypothetical protein